MNSIKFARRQVHLDPSPFDAPTDRIEHDDAVRDRHLRRRFRGAEPANSSTNSGRQLACLKWLGHIVVGAGLQRLDLVIFTIADRQHKNRHFRVYAPDAPASLYTPHSRHIDIEQDCFIIDHPQAYEAILSIARLTYLEHEDMKGRAQTASQCGVDCY